MKLLPGALLLVCGCSAGITRTLHAPTSPLETTTVFFYRTRLAGTPDTTARSMELSQRLLGAALEEGSDAFAFYGPTEFEVMRWDDDAAWIASNALPILTNSGSRPDQGLVLRSRVERRVTGSVQTAHDARGGTKGQSSNEETTWVGTVEIVHPATRSVLAELQSQVSIDVFSTPSDDAEYDEAPAMTRMMERLVRESVRVARQFGIKRLGDPLPELVTAITPKSLPVATDGETLKLDALQAELLMQNRTRFLTPSLSDAEASKYLSLPAGLKVLKSDSKKLNPGDLILSIDGEAALPQVLHRTRFAGHPVRINFQSSDGPHDIAFP